MYYMCVTCVIHMWHIWVSVHKLGGTNLQDRKRHKCTYTIQNNNQNSKCTNQRLFLQTMFVCQKH